MIEQSFVPKGDLVIEDFVTVQKAVSSPYIKTVQEKILDGSATDEEIERHYRTFDAIDSPTSFKNEKTAYLYLKAMGRVALADFIGGAQIVSGALLSGAIDQNNGYDGVLASILNDDVLPLVQHQHAQGAIKSRDIDNWDVIAEYTSSEGENTAIKNLAERVGLLQFARLTGFFDKDVIVRSTDALRALSLGRTIMREGSKGFRHYIDIQPSQIIQSAKELSVVNTLVDIAEDPNLQLGLSNLILRSGNILETPEAKDIFLNEMKNSIGPMLSWPTTGHAREMNKYQGQYYDIDTSLMRDMQQGSFIGALNNIKFLVDFAKDNNPDMFKKGRLKGSLHEVIWMLDAFAIRKGMPERYGEYGVHVATGAEDMPFLNRPVMKRGFDFVIQEHFSSAKRRLIQVGASGKKVKNKTEQPYHPNIEVYCEKSFNEVNITTLEKKIDTYSKWAEGGFTEQDFKRFKVQEKLLGTIRECFGINGQ